MANKGECARAGGGRRRGSGRGRDDPPRQPAGSQTQPTPPPTPLQPSGFLGQGQWRQVPTQQKFGGWTVGIACSSIAAEPKPAAEEEAPAEPAKAAAPAPTAEPDAPGNTQPAAAPAPTQAAEPKAAWAAGPSGEVKPMTVEPAWKRPVAAQSADEAPAEPV